jgi:hypothetical protein
VSDFVDVSEVHASSNFRVEGCTLMSFYVYIVLRLVKLWRGGESIVGIGDLSGPIETVDRKNCTDGP